MNQDNGNRTRLIFSITVIIILTTLLLDRLVPQGMFFDGITYSSIARNLAIGKGSFWQPYYRYPGIFAEHPPLMFGLEAIFFRIFGDHYLTEKIYSFVIWITTAVLLRSLWNKSITGTSVKYSYTLPLLLWTIIPTVTWGYTNNLLDSTMCLFDMAAILALYPRRQNDKRLGIGRALLASILIFCALLTKGPVGAFPLAIPAIYWFVFQRTDLRALGRALLSILIMSAVIVLLFAVLVTFPEAKQNLELYLHQQLLGALAGEREITGGKLGRFALLVELAIQLLPSIGIALILYLIARFTKSQPVQGASKRNQAFFFLLVGISGSIPIMLSIKQRSFYLIPSFPYYAMALAAIVYPYFIALTNKRNASIKTWRIYRVVSLVAVVVILGYLVSKVGDIGRDKELITDIQKLSQVFPKRQTVGICFEGDKDYAFLAYAERYHEMEVTHSFFNAKYVLINKDICGANFAGSLKNLGFKQLESPADRYLIYQRKFPMRFRFTQLNPAFPTGDK